MSGTLNAIVGLSALILFSTCAATHASSASPQNVPGNCTQDSTLRTCVTSGAITPGQFHCAGQNDACIRVSVALEFTNMTEYPIDAVFVANDEAWSFQPRNADALVPDSRGIRFAGLGNCRTGSLLESRCDYTTISPGLTFRAQVSFQAVIAQDAMPLMQLPSRAALSGSLNLRERGKQRYVPLAIPEFEIGNGLAQSR
jgi:hypothetical protein